jgi:hypothetical protein
LESARFDVVKEKDGEVKVGFMVLNVSDVLA